MKMESVKNNLPDEYNGSGLFEASIAGGSCACEVRGSKNSCLLSRKAEPFLKNNKALLD